MVEVYDRKVPETKRKVAVLDKHFLILTSMCMSCEIFNSILFIHSHASFVKATSNSLLTVQKLKDIN